MKLFRELPIPEHYSPRKVNQIYQVSYQQLAEDARQWRNKHNIPGIEKDQIRIALLVIDYQNTFCIPGFDLFVAGRSGCAAVDDSQRLSEFIYRNLGRLTKIIATLDTHKVVQIFHPIFLVNDRGNHPQPYSQVSSEDIERGVWKVNPGIIASLGFSAEQADEYLKYYSRTLDSKEKYALTIWPYHALLGSIGHALVSSIEEAIFFHTLTRISQPKFEIKGNNPLTEHYSAISAEVDHGPDGKLIEPSESEIFELVLSYDAVMIAGQAKSHCLAWTVADLLEKIRDVNSQLASKVYLLEDCTSPVVVPGADFTDQADKAFSRFARQGIHIVRSTEPIESWPGFPFGPPISI
jgi:nicotinamidase-related amidase